MTPGLIHAITPGDHFSPRTGSAVPSVVDGLSRAAADPTPLARVLVATGTYPDRYASAASVEYSLVEPRRSDRYVDAVLARLGLPRLAARRVLAAMLREQRQWEPSIVLAHNLPGLVPLVDVTRHVPVLYAHNQLLRTYSLREADRVLGSVAGIVCVSEFLADQTRDRLPARLRDLVHAVPNGVDFAAFDRPRAGRGERLRVAYVGRVIPEKGVHVLLDAVGRLGRTDLEVTVIGRPGFSADDPLTSYEEQLREQASRLPVSVRFASFVPRPKLPELLAAVDVVAVPSVWPEPFGLTALEGMAAGKAVIAADIGGLPEAVGSAGVLVPPGDADSLAQVLEALASDNALLDQLGTLARDHARANDWGTARARLDRVLGLVLAGGRAGGQPDDLK